ncbi:MAG: tRNA lysidine(34) synthetase TilS [Rhodocyclaceae bacterium]|nr:tRNA lysidine(34) synthetase TilS [Rhodocyclaceae bacterium]
MASSRKPRPADPPAALAAFLASHRFGALRLCVGLSGGVDSVALLHALCAVRESAALAISACHVHHGLNPDADHWAAFCRRICAELGVPLSIERVAVVASGKGVEAAAREARLAALARQPADWVVLGHHADDQAETVLFRLLRGAGVRGGGGMRALERRADGLCLMRPLLTVRRREIAAWARAGGLAWIEDGSNASTVFSRNFLRHEILPVMASRFPAAVERLCATAAHLRESEALLGQLAEADWRALGGGERVRVLALASLDPARRRNLVRWRTGCLGLPAPEEARLEEALRQLLAVGRDHPLRAPLGASELCHYRGWCWVQPAMAACPPRQPCEVGRTLDWAGGRVTLETCTAGGIALARLDGPLSMAPRPAGGRLRMGGMGRALARLAQAAGVPPWWRDVLPALYAGESLVWVAELGADERYAAADGEAALRPVWQPPPGVISRLPEAP